MSHLHSPIKFLYFKTKRHETEQSEKSQFGERWNNKHLGCEWGGRVRSNQHRDVERTD